MPKLTHDVLAAMPTIHSGHFANLKIDTSQAPGGGSLVGLCGVDGKQVAIGAMRVWVSRMSRADGETEFVTVERFADGRWRSVDGRTVELDGRFDGYTVVR